MPDSDMFCQKTQCICIAPGFRVRYYRIMKHSEARISKCIVVSALLLFIAGVLLFAAKHISGFAEWYSVNIYSIITRNIGYIAGIVPFSVAEAGACILPVIVIADIIRCRRRLRKAFLHILLIVSVLFFLYSANCGINYQRNSFVDQEALAEAQFTVDELEEFCKYIVGQIEKSSSGSDYPQGRELSEAALLSMSALSEDYPSLSGYYPPPKQLTLLSRVFSSMGVSGIYSPFTVEANINGEMPDMEKPFTACHELSHLRGYMNEGEANFIGWLACISSADPSFNRSGWLIAWMHAGATLRRVDPDRYDSLYKKLPAYAISEIEENRAFWASHETKASEVQDRVNDTYLKANGQEDGVQSYGMLTTLMLIYYYDSY